MSRQIFISYRRDDASYPAGRLYDRLSEHFPQSQIFIDVDSLAPGIDFVKALEESVGSCDVLIAVIGRHWLQASDEEGRRRLDNPKDFVRIEISTALSRNIRVIPVLVDGAALPRPDDLPDDLRLLLRRNALEISHDRFRADSERLIGAVKRALGVTRAERKGKRKPLLMAGMLALLALVISMAVGAAMHFSARRPEPASTPSEAAVQLSAKSAASTAVAHRGPGRLEMPPPSVGEQPRSVPEKATKEQPWQNSLGMKFVPVAGTQVLFSIWATRVQDFEMFTQTTGYNAMGGMLSLGKTGWQNFGDTWKEPGFTQEPTHPVVGVSWIDAEAFCKWLTAQERSSGILPAGRVYRLPTDEEWSAGVGLKYEVGKTPAEKSGKIMRFPWDFPQRKETSWPPPAGAGNYAGDGDNIETWRSNFGVIRGYTDGYPWTSPVGSFSANHFGLYDMGGNVWQWCEDWYYTNQSRVLRGASWFDHNDNYLLASFRSQDIPDRRQGNIGFRCVVAPESSR